MRHRLFALAGCACALALYSCVSLRPLKETSPVRIGFFADLSSTGAADGIDALKGAELRVSRLNATGGIGGRQIELFSLDMKESPAEAVKAYTQLVQDDGVCVVISSTVPNSGVAVSPVADLSRVPLLSLGIDDRVTTPDMKADNPDDAGRPRAFAFLLQASATQSAQALAWYAVEHLALKRFATLYDPVNPVSVLQAHAFENVIRKAGRSVAASVALPPGGDLGPVLRTIGDAGSEAVYVCGSVEADAAAARGLRQSLPRTMLLGNQAWYSPLATLAGDSANNAWFSMPVSPDDPAVAEIAPAFKARFGDAPRPGAIAGWDAVGVIEAAVRKAGTSDPARIRDALEQAAAFRILQGQLDMDRRTHRPSFPFAAIMQVAGATYRTIDPRYVHRPPRT